MYKLLLYNEDFGDEFNVSSLNVMSEKEYEIWENSLTGIPNEDYNKKIEVYLAAEAKYIAYMEGCKERGLWTKDPRDYTSEEQEWIKNNKAEYQYVVPSKMKESFIVAWLGNYSDYFEEPFLNYTYYKDLVKDGLVIVHDITEEFYKEFLRMDLGSTSLCNVCFMPEEYLYQNECD